MRRPTTLALLLTTFALAACGDNEADVPSDSARTEAPKTQAEAAVAPEEQGCREVPEPKAKRVEKRKAPALKLNRKKRYTAVLETSCGTLEIALDNRRFPKTSASFVALAREGFYDGLPFHRIVPDFVVQGGSPDGSPSGEPGYRVVEAPPDTITYPVGTVAMAKTAAERPGTSGSQFFMVTSDQAQFDPVYAALGRVTGGRDVLDRLAEVPTDPAADYQPTEPVVIEKVTIRER